VTTRGTLIERLSDLAADAARRTSGHPLQADALDVGSRLRRPLRVAIAGRAKAGKSTLLNALVGEQLAATDATECTRIVTWYREDLGYAVSGVLRDGGRRSFEFDRSRHGLRIHLGAQSVDDIERLEVGWPSSRLATVTLIDTPGLDGPAPGSGERTRSALIGDDQLDDVPRSDADAVIYLLRHLHRRDAEFLEAFAARGAASPSPVGAIALLARADEVGAGRADALTSAARIAERYGKEPRLRTLVSGVLPIAGLLAETGASLREDEVAALRAVARLEAAVREGLLLSVDRFRDAGSPLPPEVRQGLLDRFGLFGLRLAIGELAMRPDRSAVDLSRRLIEASGIVPLERLIATSFAARADVLKARSALRALRELARRATAEGLPGAEDLARRVEHTTSTSHELAEIRVLELLPTGLLALREDEAREVERLLDRASIPQRLGVAEDAGPADLLRTILAGIERWRTRLSEALLDRETRDAAEVVARTYEGLYQDLTLARS
jgi:hypothetical protein